MAKFKIFSEKDSNLLEKEFSTRESAESYIALVFEGRECYYSVLPVTENKINIVGMIPENGIVEDND